MHCLRPALGAALLVLAAVSVPALAPQPAHADFPTVPFSIRSEKFKDRCWTIVPPENNPKEPNVLQQKCDMYNSAQRLRYDAASKHIVNDKTGDCIGVVSDIGAFLSAGECSKFPKRPGSLQWTFDRQGRLSVGPFGRRGDISCADAGIADVQGRLWVPAVVCNDKNSQKWRADTNI
ncbi:RICIN domain-containing protein [Nocardia sp. NPDC046473]|uniref:RICIN domain-containing protein n=1 Tax=Nocardia sp. NPDC046473 TaxID=3155733 RepID=UPI003400D6DB